MRKIILFMVMSLDGFVAGPNNELDWEVRDPEIGMFLVPDFMKSVDSMIIGHVLYEGFKQTWPGMASNSDLPAELKEFAKWIQDSPKYVITHTDAKSLDDESWRNSTMIQAKSDEDVIAAVKNLKQSQGGDIVLFGGVRVAQTLVRLGLVDEYRFKIQPIFLGGKALFDNTKRANLKLTFSKVFESGVIAAYYVPTEQN